MKIFKENGNSASGPSSVTQAGNVASGLNGKIDVFNVKRKPVDNSEIFYEQLWQLDDYKE